jgi:DNA repair exonuclease SbcCD ATPase subunit
MKLPWILVIVLCIALALMYIFKPEKQDAKIAKLEHENDSLLIRISQHQANAAKLSELRKADSVAATISKQAYASEVKKKDAVIADLRRNPKVIEIVRQNPVIDTLIQAYDSALLHRDERIRELESELTSSQSLASQAEQNFKATIADYEKLHANMLEQVEHYKKELRKQRRQKRLAIVGGVVFSLGFLLLGSNL